MQHITSTIDLEKFRPQAMIGPEIYQAPSVASQPGNPKANALQQPSSAVKNSEESPGFSTDDKAKLTMALSKICEMQKAYGKTAVNLETLVDGFLWVMDGYLMQDILDALRFYIREKNDIPAPADLINIITPPSKPLSAAVYITICKRLIEGTTFVSDQEKKYRREFERREVDKIAECRVEIDRFARQHWGN